MTILTLIEHEQGLLDPQTFALLTRARELAQAQDLALHAILIGEDVYDFAEELGAYGVSHVHLIEDERLAVYAPQAWAAAVLAVISAEKPTAVVAAGSERGNEVLAHVAARSDLPLATNCFAIQPENDGWLVTRLRWGGTLHEEARLLGEIKLLTLVTLGVEAEAEPLEEQVEIVEMGVVLDSAEFLVQVTDLIQSKRTGISLADAPVVVSGGRGVGSAAGFAPLEELATLLNGAVGCSRAVTNKGWRSHADQVGQTGTRVAPELYIACGISGASQHMSGCAGSKKLLVINTDKDAPILARADYAIIGDLHEVVPAIVAALQ
ncbi:MAG TPA: electron transfer flavoprotein subunit alpha/FixB family protein [Anaerolineae bacterium]|nr:electron transfer flavoprotein subunit alpha/FixB family protein [Anaerolineae bacterium]